jgi:hypothetical protein
MCATRNGVRPAGSSCSPMVVDGQPAEAQPAAAGEGTAGPTGVRVEEQV